MEIPLISLIALIIVVGLLIWLVHTWVADAMMQKIFMTAIIVLGVLWLLSLLGAGPHIGIR